MACGGYSIMNHQARRHAISLLVFTLFFWNGFSAAQTTAPSTSPAVQWVNPQPEIPYLPKPTTRPADWVVPHDPVTPGASAEARALLSFLYDISGNHTLTGQHNYAAQQEYSTGVALRLSRKTPVIYGTDWGFARAGDKDSAFVREETVRTLIEEYRKGSIIALCWHEVPPTKDEPVTFRKDVMSKLTNQQFDDVITPGTGLYQRWCAQVDVVAGYLEELQAARVPILFRPYHEMNGDWFWWGGRRGRRGTQQLYRQMFDRLVNFHHLNNLLWVWNCDQPMREDRQFVDYFPGQQYVDILALDDYGAFQQRFYDEMNALSDGKVLAIAETGRPPTINIYGTQPKWTYWMRWATDRNRPATRPAGAINFGSNGRIPPVPLDVIVKDPRMLSLEDGQYWQLIAPLRALSGLPDTRPADTDRQ
jgi:mannan endo-1,4-beta-mannosidase